MGRNLAYLARPYAVNAFRLYGIWPSGGRGRVVRVTNDDVNIDAIAWIPAGMVLDRGGESPRIVNPGTKAVRSLGPPDFDLDGFVWGGDDLIGHRGEGAEIGILNAVSGVYRPLLTLDKFESALPRADSPPAR
jgi:hypothetical protein